MILPPGFRYINGRLRKRSSWGQFINATAYEAECIAEMHKADVDRDRARFDDWRERLEQRRGQDV